MRIRADRADDHGVSIDLWHRTVTAVRERYRASAAALYGTGLHTDEDDGVTGLTAIGVPEVGVPAPRRAPSSPAAATVPHHAVATSR